MPFVKTKRFRLLIGLVSTIVISGGIALWLDIAFDGESLFIPAFIVIFLTLSLNIFLPFWPLICLKRKDTKKENQIATKASSEENTEE